MATITLNVPDNIGIDMVELKQRLGIYIQTLVTAFLSKSKTDKKSAHSIDYPNIPANLQVSQDVLNMAIGKLPNDIDWDKETATMWEEMAV